MTLAYFLKFSHPLSNAEYESKLSNLPLAMQKHVQSFRRWENAHESLFGKMLLSKGLSTLKCLKTLHDVTYSKYGHPILPGVGFNISHSAGRVGCVVSSDTTCIGIDVELIKQIDLLDYESILTQSELIHINKDMKRFYQYWTSKEAIAKAIGLGMSISLKDIEISSDKGLYKGNNYFLKHLQCEGGVAVTIATEKDVGVIKINIIDADSL
ncbi:4'-phosphopantetheinyl transferase [Algoriphagus sp. 4150]|uniref:4'-phosphopantetheinyl transferase family protein n=1 Tax=Algoriphagus sp. 4150 TaxID=2817756 RepID=UPI00285F66AB|nr:4'-phosphopantetheinyl transferase superfamily protein [Algoriphagus sp. 4150]MDR7132751.1 4'-phosphopantetheinyl transferase [Algoriphagus sp. 4150]